MMNVRMARESNNIEEIDVNKDSEGECVDEVYSDTRVGRDAHGEEIRSVIQSLCKDVIKSQQQRNGGGIAHRAQGRWINEVIGDYGFGAFDVNKVRLGGTNLPTFISINLIYGLLLYLVD